MGRIFHLYSRYFTFFSFGSVSLLKKCFLSYLLDPFGAVGLFNVPHPFNKGQKLVSKVRLYFECLAVIAHVFRENGEY